jgi:hypothetical protein
VFEENVWERERGGKRHKVDQGDTRAALGMWLIGLDKKRRWNFSKVCMLFSQA